MQPNSHPKIAMIGLGYVGLPLAVALARHFSVVGFDINEKRIAELKKGFDNTNEIDTKTLQDTSLKLTSNSLDLQSIDVYIVTVPTPVTKDNLPDLTPLQKASETIGKVLTKNAIVVFESTVYPGVTEEFCGPILERESKLKQGKDFYLGYSPERINPGDTEHTVDRIVKVIAGQTPEVVEILKNIYGKMNGNKIFIAKNIKTAEAAKVIENAQRDINIAFINEIAIIADKLGLSVYDVLAASNTKWNFLKFTPGLVGGHCIGVDPYYLAYCSRKLNHEPDIILAGRHMNESMSTFIANTIHQRLEKIGIKNKSADILVLGLTFKEDIPDLRNTKTIDLIEDLRAFGHTVEVHDALATQNDAKMHLQIDLLPNLTRTKKYDCIIGTVAHKPYLQLTTNDFQRLLKPEGLVADIKNMWNQIKLPQGLHYWTL